LSDSDRLFLSFLFLFLFFLSFLFLFAFPGARPPGLKQQLPFDQGAPLFETGQKFGSGTTKNNRPKGPQVTNNFLVPRCLVFFCECFSQRTPPPLFGTTLQKKFFNRLQSGRFIWLFWPFPNPESLGKCLGPKFIQLRGPLRQILFCDMRCPIAVLRANAKNSPLPLGGPPPSCRFGKKNAKKNKPSVANVPRRRGLASQFPSTIPNGVGRFAFVSFTIQALSFPAESMQKPGGRMPRVHGDKGGARGLSKLVHLFLNRSNFSFPIIVGF